MWQQHSNALRRAILALAIALLAAAFTQRAFQNLARIDYRNSNFVFFWMAGRMVVMGQSPYDSTEWLAQHELNRVSWRSDQVFSYPLPVALIMAPLGLLPLEGAYLVWQLLSQTIMAATVWAALLASGAPRPQALFVPLVLMLLFFGPVYLTVQIGALGALGLGAMVPALIALDKRRPLLAGALLSILLLKPPQGLPILLLGGIWMLFHRSWRAILGIALGAVILLFAGLVLDPNWPAVFMRSSEGLLNRNLGLHSNVFSLARDWCGSDGICTWVLGGIAALLLWTAVLAYLWRRRNILTHWEAFSLIIPAAFVAALYAWSYDQILYVIPIAWVVGRLTRMRGGYLSAFAFMLLVLTISDAALAIHALTGTDLLNSVTTFVVLLGVGAARTKSPPFARGHDASLARG